MLFLLGNYHLLCFQSTANYKLKLNYNKYDTIYFLDICHDTGLIYDYATLKIFHFLSFVSALRLKKYFIAKLNCLNMSYHCNCQNNTNDINYQNYIFGHYKVCEIFDYEFCIWSIL